MSCFSCCAGPEPGGVEDAHRPGAYQIKVSLSTGLEVKVYVLPSDTSAVVKRKVESVHGRQPDVAIKGRMVSPPLCARYQGKWLPMNDDATMNDVGRQTSIKYADISDQARNAKLFSHAHWAASNAFVYATAN